MKMDKRERVAQVLREYFGDCMAMPFGPESWEEGANLVITAFDAALKEEGLVVVPREPNDAMLEVGSWDAFVYTAMIEAWEKDNG